MMRESSVAGTGLDTGRDEHGFGGAQVLRLVRLEYSFSKDVKTPFRILLDCGPRPEGMWLVALRGSLVPGLPHSHSEIPEKNNSARSPRVSRANSHARLRRGSRFATIAKGVFNVLAFFMFYRTRTCLRQGRRKCGKHWVISKRLGCFRPCWSHISRCRNDFINSYNGFING